MNASVSVRGTAAPRKLRTRPRTLKPASAPRPTASASMPPERKMDGFVLLLYVLFALGCLVIAGIYYAILYGQPV